MNSLTLHLKKLDWILILAVLLLTGIGFLAIYSSSLGSGDFLNLQKQIIFFLAGFFLMILASFFDWRNFQTNTYLVSVLYFISLASLVLLFFFAPEIRGTKSWFKIGEFSIDPAEFMKIIAVIVLAKYFSMRHTELYRVWHIILSGIYIFIPVALIFFQPNLGSVLILVAIWVGMLFVSGIKLRHFLILVAVFFLIFALSWGTILKDYQKERIISFFQPQLSDPLAIGWSQTQSKIAIGSGGMFGQGIGKGSQTQYGFLSEPHTDFTFAVIAEETGLLGVFAVFLLFSILIWRIFKIVSFAQNNFARLFATGLGIILISHIFINVGMNIGLLPIIGIPLPLISYGGSGLIILFTAFGIMQSIKINN